MENKEITVTVTYTDGNQEEYKTIENNIQENLFQIKTTTEEYITIPIQNIRKITAKQ